MLSNRTAFLIIAAALAATPLTAQEADPDAALQVTRAVMATDVVDREPVGEAESFAAGVGQVYFYTVFEGDFPETQLEHVWLREGEEMARVALTVRGPRWRTWSSKVIPADWAGDWEVQVVDGAGNVLESASFTVGG